MQGHSLICDLCGRQENTAAPVGWGVLTSTAPNGTARREDVCLWCIARMRGWDNPVIVGTGKRLREVI